MSNATATIEKATGASKTGNATVKILIPETLIRVKGFRNWQDITVCTIRSAEFRDAKRNGLSDEAATAAGEEGIEQAKRFGHSLAPWSYQSPGVLESNYPGKAEKAERERAAREAAPMIEAGEVVEIEGELYRVRIAGENYSDPVHFVKI